MTHSTLLGIGHCRFIFLLKHWHSAKRRGDWFLHWVFTFCFFTAQKGGVHVAAVLLHSVYFFFLHWVFTFFLQRKKEEYTLPQCYYISPPALKTAEILEKSVFSDFVFAETITDELNFFFWIFPGLFPEIHRHDSLLPLLPLPHSPHRSAAPTSKPSNLKPKP